MQALRRNKGNSGAVLIGAIVISLVLAISTVGLIGLSRNASNQNYDTSEEARAFLAAEAGLYVGTYWYRNAQPVPTADDPGFTITHDGIKVAVKLMEPTGVAAPDAPPQVRITATADHKALPYRKMLEWTVTQSKGEGIPSGYFAYFIDKSDYSNANDPNLVNKKESAYDGFRRSCVFDGPVHFNEPLWMSRSDKPVFRSIVSIFNPPQGTIIPGITGFYNNYGIGTKGDYSKGGLKIGGDPNSGKTDLTETPLLDAVIGTHVSGKALIIQEEQYTVNFRDPFAAAANITFTGTLAEIRKGTDPEDGMVWNILPKPAVADTLGSFLRFGIIGTGTDGKAGTASSTNYTFFEKSGSQWKPHVGTIPQGEGDRLIIQADFPLTVRDGKMKGTVSVRTTDGNNIYFDLKNDKKNNGNLTYDISNTIYTSAISNVPAKQSGTDTPAHSTFINNYGGKKNYGMDENYLLAFYSGRNIDFLKYDEGAKSIITAQIFAKNGQVVVPYSGSLKNCINIIGSCVAKYWWNYSGNANKDDTFRVWHDPRTMSAPGVSLAGSEGGDGTYGGKEAPVLFTKIKYKETNFPR